MSDTESVISTVFDVSSVADQSDLETIESSDITRNIPTPYEYVSVTINIEETLACDFKRHSQYYRTTGKFFPVGSPDAERRMYRLIDDFLETYDIPTARRAQNTLLITKVSNILGSFHHHRLCLFSDDCCLSAYSTSFQCTLEKTSRRRTKALILNVSCMLPSMVLIPLFQILKSF